MQVEKDIAPHAEPRDWPNPIKLSIWLVYEDEHWSALASEFDVVGMGSSKEAAMENLREMLTDYLDSYWQEGASFEQVRRPIPWRERLRLRLGAIRTAASERLRKGRGKNHHPGPPAVRHSHLDVTPDGFVVPC